ncbi:hypothetical protein Poli38472_007436 [Pythium oligandrum]|uniref:Centrosomin N-terminal motif 1 domain-containing protein n=1 Tax=Pythium oligandrum TaxID=41045 RepID=A0A8K1CQI0_PYTOL|nr:hypothetical protein Poli38472_007436 [Pythium oligandrum]|eukprot:TMW67764.1 hypothetical protein Poli38472_007436 [Pythium oligandrum]
MASSIPATPRPSKPLGASTASMSDSMDGPASVLLREQQHERDRLAMENFNLKMRINYLEERLLRYQNGLSVDQDDLENDLLQVRLALAEKEQELRERNHSMLRASEAINMLQQQLIDAHAEVERTKTEPKQLEELETLRHELGRTQEELRCQVERVRGLEGEVGSRQEENGALRAKYEDADEMRRRMERELAQCRDKLKQMEQQQSKGVMEVDHLRTYGKQRDEQLTSLKEQVEKVSREKQQLEVKFQGQAKRMEEAMKAELQKLQQECEKYRNEQMRVTSERDKLHFERERVMMEVDGVKQEKARYQTEWERLNKELERVTGEAEALRLRNVKLTATCEHQAQSLESFKNEREGAMDNMHKMESEVNEWRRTAAECELALKQLEMRAKSAEAEVQRLQQKLENVTARTQQSANERLVALEQGKNAIEAQNFELRRNLSTLQNQLESFEAKCRSYEERINEESGKTKEFRERFLASERELRQRTSQAEHLERQLAQATNTSADESSRMQQYSDQINHVTNERNELMETLAQERARAAAMQQTHSELQASHAAMNNQLEAIGRELRTILGLRSTSPRGGYHQPLDTMLREVKSTLQRQFKAEAEVLFRRWQEQAEAMRLRLERQSAVLHKSEAKLEMLERTNLHAKDDVRTLDRTWSVKYDTLRSEYESMRRSLEEALRAEMSKNAQLDAALKHAQSDLSTTRSTKEGALNELERDNFDLKESNRLLMNELQERRRAAEHARKQYLRAVAENKDLLGAIDILKSGLMDRDRQIEIYKANLVKLTQQLQRRGSMGEVKQKLLEQLEQTQFMVTETYKRWSTSEIGSSFGASLALTGREAWSVQLEESVSRMEVVGDRWREYLNQSRDFQRRYADAWRTAALSFGKGKDRPSWVDDVERKCGRLLSESVRVSEVMRDVVEDVVNALQSARKDRKRHRQTMRKEATSGGNNAEILSMEHFNGDNDYTPRSNNDPTSPHRAKGYLNSFGDDDIVKKRSSTRHSSVLRNGTSAIYGHSLASLGRIGDELQAIERKIKTYPDER